MKAHVYGGIMQNCVTIQVTSARRPPCSCRCSRACHVMLSHVQEVIESARFSLACSPKSLSKTPSMPLHDYLLWVALNSSTPAPLDMHALHPFTN